MDDARSQKENPSGSVKGDGYTLKLTTVTYDSADGRQLES